VPVGERDLRLVEQLELVALDRAREVGLHREPRLQLVAHLAVVKHAAGAAGGLGVVEREVGIADQLVGRGAIGGEDRKAGADADAQMAFAERERLGRERLHHPPPQLLEPRARLRAADRQGELVARKPRDDAAATDHRA